MAELKITRRHLPHWKLDSALYFVTFRTVSKILHDEEKQIAFDHIIHGNGNFYSLISMVIMPDHIHLIIKPNRDYSLSRILKGIKGVSARLINRHRQSKGRVWQDESFDRIIRDVKELHQKIQYMYLNAFKSGLISNPNEYRFWFFDPEWDKDPNAMS